MTSTTTERRTGAGIEVSGVSKHYGQFVALDQVSLAVKPGEFMAFLGPSGSGKTTMLNLIAGFTDMTAGEIRLDGRSIGNVPAHKRNIGVVFQHYALFPHMLVAQNVAYPLKQRKVPRARRNAAVIEALRKVELADFATRYPGELSGGQQQRVALARAMVFDPPLLLMDEPLGALDKKLRESLQLEIRRIHNELGSTFVYVTHDQEEALVLADRIAVFNHGCIEQVGTGHALYTNPRTLFVGRFIGESTILRGPYRVNGNETAFEVAGHRVIAPSSAGGAGEHVILLRPEAIAVKAPGAGVRDGRSNVIAGTVREMIYLGSTIRYEITLADGTIVSARTGSEDEHFAVGRQVEIAWRPANGILLPDDGSAITI